MRRTLIAITCVVVVLAPSLFAQRSGQSAKLTSGKVVKIERVQLQSDAAKGALVGGVVGYHLTSKNKSSSRKWANAAAGAAVAGAAKRASEGDLTGILYTVDTGGGSMVKVISDQTEIRQGDCVMIEEIKDTVNIRRMDGSACDPKRQAAMKEIDAELQEEASECVAAKELLLKAETDEEIELAVRKVKLLCSN
jgi:hypothetical protein